MKNEKKRIQPQTRKELEQIIKENIRLYGSECNLNHIDVSLITDMRYLFEKSQFNGNISEWDVSNVENIECLFFYSKFNGDISQWDVSKVKNMRALFNNSQFNGDISQWAVINVKDMSCIFYQSKFTGNVSQWKPYSVTKIKKMFEDSLSPIPYWYSEDTDEIRYKLKQKEVEELSLKLENTNNVTQSKNKL